MDVGLMAFVEAMNYDEGIDLEEDYAGFPAGYPAPRGLNEKE